MRKIKRLPIVILGMVFMLCLALFGACAPKTIKLSFETNGGTAIPAIEAEAGADISSRLPSDPVRSGYLFEGWYLERDFSGTRQTLPKVMPEKNTTYYAKWTEAAPATLTLTAVGGTLAQSSYEVAQGVNLLSFLADKTPTPEEGLTFAGWFKGGVALGENETMPAGGLALTAKFYAPVTVNLYIADTEGNYSADPSETLTEQAIYGDPYRYTPENDFRYTPDNGAAGAKLSSDALGKNEVFSAYFKRASVLIRYDVNLDVEGKEVEDLVAVYGSTVSLANGDAFALSREYRFIGYAETPEGDVKYRSDAPFNTSLMTDVAITLYAKWELAAKDFFGGTDLIFVSTLEENTVFLRREGMRERRGTYDSLSGYFSFREGNKLLLEGKLSGKLFYYFADLADMTFTAGDGSRETIHFEGGQDVTYTTAQGEISGVYSIDTITGEYLFESERVTFHFTINYSTTESGTVYLFNREKENTERGFYLYKNSQGELGGNVLFLDGMVDENGIGGLTAFREENGVLDPAYPGFYLYDSESATYSLLSSSGDTLFLFRLNPADKGSLQDVELAGSFTTSDGFNGSFVEYYGMGIDDTPTLILDGFGKGTYQGKQGTYTVESIELMAIDEEGQEPFPWSYDYISFKLPNEPAPKYFQIGFDQLLYYLETERPRVVELAHAPSKVYGIHDALPEHAAFFLTGADSLYVFAYEYDESIDANVYHVIDRGLYQEKEDEKGVYEFESLLYTDSAIYEFKIENGKIVTTVPGAMGYEFDGMSVDRWGELSFNGKTYSYGEWTVSYIYDYFNTFVVEIYTFDGKDHFVFAVYDEEYGDERALLEENAIVDLVFRQFYGQDSYFDRIFLMEDQAAIALVSDDGRESFVIYGDLYYDDETKEYYFSIDESMELPQINAMILEQYSEFSFRMGEFNGKTAAIANVYAYEAESADGATFVPDGYGRAVYTPKGGTAIEGTYQSLDPNGMFVGFTSDDGETSFFVTFGYDESKDVYTFRIMDAPEAGPHYLVLNGGIYYSDYIVLFGDATDDEDGNAFYGGYYGSYRKTGKTVSYWMFGGDWVEYELSFQDSGSDFTFRVAINRLEIEGGGVVSGYLDEMPRQYADFTVEEGGTVSGDGYNVSYTVGGDIYYGSFGIGYIQDGSAIAEDYRWSDDFANGRQLIFYGDYVVRGGMVYLLEDHSSFLFDISTDRTTLSLRDPYNATCRLYERGELTERTIYLDGHGKAVRRDALGILEDEGTYRYVEEEGALLFTSTKEGGKSYFFKMSSYTQEETTYFIYYVLDESYVYVSSDWSVLMLGALEQVEIGGTTAFINARYIDARGGVEYGFYTFLTDKLVCLERLDHTKLFFDLNVDTFERNSEEFIIRNGVLLGYQGARDIVDLKLPEDVREIGYGVFSNMTRISSSDLKNYTLDLNNVEIIGDYAFYNTYFFLNEIRSEKVTHVGKYAFAVEAFGYDSIVSSLSDVYLPNAKVIGDYAFYGCNTMNIGVTVLKAVEYIGRFAFTHNYFTSGETMELDLTEADIAKIQMDPNAFFPGWNTNEWEKNGLPVRIYVADARSYFATANWAEAIRQCVHIRGGAQDDPFAESGFFEFASGTYLAFGGEEKDGLPTVTRYLYASSEYTAEAQYAVYGVNGDGSATILLPDNTTVDIGADDTTLTVGSTTYYRAGAKLTFEINEGGSNKNLVFTFSVEAYHTDLYTDLTVYIDGASYDGFEASYASYASGVLTVTYTDESASYEIAIDLSARTAERESAGIVVYSEDNAYRGIFSSQIAEGWYYLTLQKRGESGEYTDVLTDVRRSSDEKGYFYRGSVKNEDVETTYTVRLTENDEKIEVEETTVKSRTFETQDQAYSAELTFGEDETSAIELKRLRKKTSYGYYEDIYGEYSYGVTAEKTGENTFKVTVSGSAPAEYTITFVPGENAHIEVVAKVFTTRTVETAHGQNEDYCEVKLLLDGDGNVVQISEVITYTYNNFGGWYDNFTYSVPSDTENQNGTFVFESSGTQFTVTVSRTGEEYTVTVEYDAD